MSAGFNLSAWLKLYEPKHGDLDLSAYDDVIVGLCVIDEPILPTPDDWGAVRRGDG